MAGRTVTIELDRERRLFYDLNALADLGERLGVTFSFDKFHEVAQQQLPLSALRAILFHGLRHEDAALTEEQVGRMVHQENIGEVFTAFLGLFGARSSETNDSIATEAASMDGLSRALGHRIERAVEEGTATSV